MQHHLPSPFHFHLQAESVAKKCTTKMFFSRDIAISLFILLAVLTVAFKFPVTKAQIGLVCTKNSDCKMGSSFVCGSRRSCECDRGHRFDLFKFTCVRHLADQSQRCDPNKDVCKGGPHAVCAANFLGEKPTCQCEHGYMYHESTELCQNKEFITDTETIAATTTTKKPPSGVPQGGFCTTNADCRGYPNATCYYFVGNNKRECDCKFESHYYDDKLGNCVAKKPIGSACNTVDECINIAHVECSKRSKTCGCKMEFYYDISSKTCKRSVEIGDTCTVDEQCKARPNSQCRKAGGSIAGKCGCLPSKTFYEGGQTCVDTEATMVLYGHPCMPTSKCEGGEYAECKNLFIGMNPICTCKDGYEFDSGSRSCRKESELQQEHNGPPNDSDNNGDGSSSSGGNESTNINLDLKFNIFLKVICNSSGNCQTTNATVT